MTASCPHNESAAFQQALLKSQRLRIVIVLCTIAAAFLPRTIRTAIVAGRENVFRLLITLGLLSLFAAYESMMLRAVDGAIRKGKKSRQRFVDQQEYR